VGTAEKGSRLYVERDDVMLRTIVRPPPFVQNVRAHWEGGGESRNLFGSTLLPWNIQGVQRRLVGTRNEGLDVGG
jgi:hypothetical protein